MLKRGAISIERGVIGAWRNMRTCMQRMYPASDVRPREAYDVFKFGATGSDDDLACEIKPVVFLVPERASHSQPNLYVG